MVIYPLRCDTLTPFFNKSSTFIIIIPEFFYIKDIYELDDDLTARTGGAYNFDTYKHSLNIANLIAEKAEKLVEPEGFRPLIPKALDKVQAP